MRDRPMYYDPDGNPYDDVIDWAEAFESRFYGDRDWWQRQSLCPGGYVSTVWLGIDHSFGIGDMPLIYETMAFGTELDEEQWRWPTRDIAFELHRRIVRWLWQRFIARTVAAVVVLALPVIIGSLKF